MALKDKMSVGRKGEVVMSNATGGQEIPTPEVNTTTDPRSKILLTKKHHSIKLELVKKLKLEELEEC
jgi:hypothetical protein